MEQKAEFYFFLKKCSAWFVKIPIFFFFFGSNKAHAEGSWEGKITAVIYVTEKSVFSVHKRLEVLTSEVARQNVNLVVCIFLRAINVDLRGALHRQQTNVKPVIWYQLVLMHHSAQ